MRPQAARPGASTACLRSSDSTDTQAHEWHRKADRVADLSERCHVVGVVRIPPSPAPELIERGALDVSVGDLACAGAELDSGPTNLVEDLVELEQGKPVSCIRSGGAGVNLGEDLTDRREATAR